MLLEESKKPIDQLQMMPFEKRFNADVFEKYHNY